MAKSDRFGAFLLGFSFVVIAIVAVFLVYKTSKAAYSWQYDWKYSEPAQKQIRQSMDPLETRIRELEERVRRLEAK